MSEEKESERVALIHACEEHTVIGTEEGEVHVLSPLAEGKEVPPGSRLVNFEDRGEPGFVEMRTICRTPGPAKVNSRQYKSGWDNVFGKKANPKGLN